MSENTEEPDRDPLDMTLREALGACGQSNYDTPEGYDTAGRLVIREAFTDAHPAVAGTLVRELAEGLDDGFTAQGKSHPDFQRVLRPILVEGGDGQ